MMDDIVKVPAAPLFEAMSTPPHGLSLRTIYRVGLLLGGAAVMCGIGFAWLGAWPVFGFLGVEVLLVLTLLSSYVRWSSRAFELVRLADGRLTIERDNGRGRREAFVLDAYWVRASWVESVPGQGRLFLFARGGRIEIGLFLSCVERRSLHNALDEALFAWRNPAFDNAQLRVENF